MNFHEALGDWETQALKTNTVNYIWQIIILVCDPLYTHGCMGSPKTECFRHCSNGGGNTENGSL